MKRLIFTILALVTAPLAFAGTLQKGHTTEIIDIQNTSPLGTISGQQLDSIITYVGRTVDQPGRMFATFPTPDALLHIRAPQTTTGDGGARSVASTTSLVPISTTDTTINFLTAATTGATVLVDGAAFALPTGSTIGHFRRMVAVYQKDGTINTHFGADQASSGNLENPGTLMSSLSGDPIGWIDLTAVSSSTYKTIGSATSIIENSTSSIPRITSFGSGGGGGSGNGSSFILWHAVDGNAPLKVEEFSEETYQFGSGLGQQLRGTLKVPTSYIAGNPVKIKLAEYSPDTSGTALLTCTSYLIRSATPDAVSSTTNSRTSTNTAVTLASPANAYHEVTCDVTNTTGTVNSVSVSPGDLLVLYLTRGTDTATSDLRFIPSSTEVTFQ